MQRHPTRILKAVALIISAIVLAGPVRAEGLSADTDSQQTARALLMAMADFLSKADSFSVVIHAGYDVLQESGQKIEFGQKGEISLDRPERMAVASESSDGDVQRIVMDGSFVTVADEQAEVYAQTAQPGSLDQTIVYFVQDLQMRLPLAPLFMQALPAELQRRVLTIDYVELDNTLDVPTHHIAGRTETVDFQIWIADGEQPVPMRVVLTYVNADGAPQFWANFNAWNFAPQFKEGTFAFAPAKDAKRIPFASELSLLTPGAPKPGTEGVAQ